MKALTAVLALVSASAWAQTSEWNVEGVHHIWYVVPTGADIAWTSDPWKLVLGAGIDQPHFGRDLETGDLRPETDPYLKPLVPTGRIEFLYTAKAEWADAWVGPEVVGYQARGGTAAAFPDWSGNAFWALDTGLQRKRVTYNDHGLKSGYTATVRAEWSPSLLSLKGTDYYQVTLKTGWFVPLWDLPAEKQLFSGLLALRADAEYTNGSQVPLVRLDATEVRGYDNTFDARALTAASAELRMRLPALGTWITGLWKGDQIVPVGFGFVDAGTYSGFADATSNTGKSGLLVGAGIGGGLEIAGYATPTLTLAMPLVGVKKTIWWDLGFQLAF